MIVVVIGFRKVSEVSFKVQDGVNHVIELRAPWKSLTQIEMDLAFSALTSCLPLKWARSLKSCQVLLIELKRMFS
jgi:hypothetical protein